MCDDGATVAAVVTRGIVQEQLDNLVKDQVQIVVKNHLLICAVGSFVLDSETKFNQHVSQVMRQLGRLFIVLGTRSKNLNASIQDFITLAFRRSRPFWTKQLCYEDR